MVVRTSRSAREPSPAESVIKTPRSAPAFAKASVGRRGPSPAGNGIRTSHIVRRSFSAGGGATDPIGDMLVSLKNGAAAGHEEVVVPYSQVKENVADLLVREGFLGAVRKFRQQGQERFFLSLQQPKLEHSRRLSKPGARWNAPRNRLPNPDQGIVIVSTSKGMMTHRQARKSKLGGELLAEVW